MTLLRCVWLALIARLCSGEFAMMAYVPEYRFGIDFNLLASRTSALVLFSLEVDEQSRLVGLDRFGGDVLTRARAARDAHGTMLLVCIGGGGRSNALRSTIGSMLQSKRLAAEIGEFVKRESLDGVDLDVEASGVSGKNYVAFVRELRAVLAPGAIVSVALHVGDANIAALAPVVDRIGLMAYDSCPELPCRHSTPEFAAHALQQAIDSGVDASKLMLGIPLYGRVMNNPAEAVPYYDIVKAGKVSDSSDLDAKKRVYFNNKATIGRKIAHAASVGAGGVFFWEAGQDESSATQSLLGASWSLIQSMSSKAKTAVVEEEAPVAQGEL
jgi:GH18 family chitinase